MKSVSWYYNLGKLSLNEHQLNGLPDALEDAWLEREDACVPVWALLLLKAHASWRDRTEEKRCGLLLARAEQEDTYRRVGFFECSDMFHRGCANAFAGFETREVRII